MAADTVIFYLLALIIVGGCVRVVSTRNLLHSVLAAFIVLVATAALYFLLNAEFLGVVQVLVYAGAVTILVLFVVMLTTAGPKYQIAFEGKTNPLMIIFTALFFGLLMFIILQVEWPIATAALKEVTSSLAFRIFWEYLLPFEVASILLLAALVGAIVLARKE